MLREDSRDMLDLLAYLETLRNAARPPGVDSVLLQGVPTRGRREYRLTCVRCHGADGNGTPIAPAVWGAGSYSIGAGLARQFTLATFLRHNMPFDHVVSLSDRQAADVAAYVLAQPRQDHPGKERDWPKGDAPPDVAYRTTAARRAGTSLPAPRPLLRRRVSADSLQQH
jgi:thiosulfate dehydrogenase